MMVERRHPEDAPAEHPEGEHLQDHGPGDEDVQPAEQEQQQMRVRQQRQGGQDAAQRL